MLRTEIQITDRQARWIRERARRRGVSFAEVARECIDARLVDDPAERDMRFKRLQTSFVGRGKDKRGTSDLAENHDRYLDEAFS
ncbi:MAG: hypothetical protein ACRD01_13510 [Terriglobales bacterium]